LKKRCGLFLSSHLLSCCLIKGWHGTIISLLLINFVSAQQVNTHLYTVRDGLPSSSIYSAYEDHLGYLWIGTPNGLSRFDGRQFLNFDLADGLPSLYVDEVFDDSRHRLWVGTRNGMARLMGNKFIVYPLSDSLQIDYTFNIVETRTKEIWALTTKGVYRFEDSIWRKLPLYPGSENFHCRQMIETDSGLYLNYGDWIVFRNKKNKWRLMAESHSYQTAFFNGMYEHNGQIFVNTRNSILVLKSDRLVPFMDNLKGDSYFNYWFDLRNRLWYYFQEGDPFFHVSMPGKWQYIVQHIPNKYGIISSMKEDSHGNIWVATQEGLLKINEAFFFRSYQ
jgi:ligand-binding sensor domain-containing protein